MNANSEGYKVRPAHNEDRPTNERQPPAPTDELHDEPVGRILDLLKSWTEKVAILVLSFFTLVHLVIFEAGRLWHGPPAVAVNQSTVQPGLERSTVGDHLQEQTEVATEAATNPTTEAATNPTATEPAPNPTATEASIPVKRSSDLTSLTRPKGRKGASIVRDSSRTSPKVEARSRKLVIEDFTLPLGKTITFSEVNGVVRSRELPSPTVATSWGNSTVRN